MRAVKTEEGVSLEGITHEEAARLLAILGTVDCGECPIWCSHREFCLEWIRPLERSFGLSVGEEYDGSKKDNDNGRTFVVKCSEDVLKFIFDCMREFPCDKCSRYVIVDSPEGPESACEDPPFCVEIIDCVEEALYGRKEKQA